MYSDKITKYDNELRRLEASLDSGIWNIRWKENFVYFLYKDHTPLEQGWKLHLSCQASELDSIITTVLPLIIKEAISFKIVSAFETALALNLGEGGKSQIGKIVTVYPNSTEEAYNLGQKINSIWFESNAPCPPSDLFFNDCGNVSIRFGAINNKYLVKDERNNLRPALISPSGDHVPDIYYLDGRQIEWAPQLPGKLVSCSFWGKERAFLKNIEGGRYHCLYPIFTKTFSSIFFCFDTIELKPVLVKVFHKRAGEDKNGYLLVDKARNEVYVANELSKHNLSPQVFATYEDDFFYYTVSEYILGKTFAELEKDERIEKLPILLSGLQKMHNLGFVHRDLKLANIMVLEDALFFVDFELTGKVNDTMPFVAETPTYAPPEGPLATIHPSYDSFSLGNCIIHSYTGFEPGLMPANPLKRLEVSKFYIPARTRELIKLLYDSNPYKRPTPHECIKYITKPSKRKVTISERGIEGINEKISGLLKQGMAALQSSAIYDDDGVHWNSAHGAAREEFLMGINTGMGGVLLGLLMIAQATSATAECKSLVEKSVSFIKSRTAKIDYPGGMFSGLAGAALAMGAAYKAYPDIDVLEVSYDFLIKAANKEMNFDLYSGYAGIAYVAMQLFKISHQHRFMEIADHCIRILVDHREVIDNVSAWKVERLEDIPRYETGVAHGTIGIAFVIGLYGAQARSILHLDIAKHCFAEVFEYARDSEKRYIHQNLGNRRHKTINKTWCHGEAGYLWAIIQIPELFEDLQDEIETVISDCLNVSHLSNPTYCHGMAGSLEMWRLVNGTSFGNRLTKHYYLSTLYELSSLSQMFGTYELFSSEENTVCSPDLWVGYTGSLSSLALAQIGSEHSILKLDSYYEG